MSKAEGVKTFSLPKLQYGYDALSPFMSEEQLRLHHDKHHQAYVNGANAIFEKLDRARENNVEIDLKSTLKELSFHIGGHMLHSVFWDCMAPAGKGGGKPDGVIADRIDREFGSFERFKMEFTKAANSVEGSGWAVLTLQECIARPLIMQVEKHNVNVYPGFRIVLALDLWEHAYYVDYKNDRSRFVDGFWNVVNWEYVNKVCEMIK
ncbi:MAG: superoxide dismutase [Candidatus Bathyarchaeota archaeon]|nr:superoxide dismutase [Candidatus Bathyarchaeota archaeon]